MCDVKSDLYIIEEVVYNVITFYQGALSLEYASSMPLPLLYKAEDHAARIAKETRKAARKTHG